MKKSLLLLMFSFVFFGAHAQWYKKAESVKGNGVLVTNEREIGSFNKIKVSGAVDVYIHHSTEYRVEVTTDENIIEYITTEVQNQELVVKSEANLRKFKELIVNIYTPSFDRISVSGASDMWIKDRFEMDEVKIDASGASNISADNLNARSIITHASGATDVTIGGNCESMEVHASGSSDVIAKDLNSKTCRVDASGASDVVVTASGNIKGSLSGSSDLEYYGNPSKVEVKTSGASDVSKGE